MTPLPVPAPARPADQGPAPEQPAPETDEVADLFRWMSWSAAIAMNA